MARSARRVHVNGIVQGVGFRPFVYQLARRHGLAGEVANTATGVVIHVEGAPESLAAFESELATSAPPLASVVAVEGFSADARGLTDFRIAASRAGEAMATLIAPDAAVCAACLAEMFDPRNRRYRYPFINCTHCGPRYTIIDDIPYDRPKTAMACFPMCAACRAEYEDPRDRRFHAQPNACPACGPRLALRDAAGRPLAAADPVAAAAELIRQGRILAIKGLGGFHLAVEAGDEQAVRRLRRRKRREEKPFAVMAADLAAVRRLARVAPEEERLLASVARPIVLLEKRDPFPLAAALAPGNHLIGAMLPYTPLHHLLMAEGFAALVMTSANLSEEPIAVGNREAIGRLAGIADAFLTHDRDIRLRADDSVVRRAAGGTRFVRRSRGYVPAPIFLRRRLAPVLGCGAELKSTVCLLKGDQAFLSQHIGDLENLETYEFYRRTRAHLERILEVRPEAAACDLHPDYLSTRFAEQESGLPVIRVQHHHAHVVAVMAEHRLEGPVIGIACDGTGYGPDGTIWGGEVLAADESDFERAAHLAPVPMPGGAAAIREPWRMALSHLRAAFGADGVRGLNLPLFEAVGAARIDFVLAAAERGVNAPATSSLGRLFDAVAALCGLRRTVSFEGQAAMELEAAAGASDGTRYETELTGEAPIRMAAAPLIRGVVDDLRRGVPVARVSARFHDTLVAMLAEVCERLRAGRGLNRVVATGGVFQNGRLLAGLREALATRGFEVFCPRLAPANDGGIALGQAVCAASRIAAAG